MIFNLNVILVAHSAGHGHTDRHIVQTYGNKAKFLSWNGTWVETGAFSWRAGWGKFCLRLSIGCVFCPSGLPLFQRRYRFNSGTLRCIQNGHWILISHGRDGRPPSRRDYSWVFFPRFCFLKMFFRLDSYALHRSVKFQVPDDFPGYSLGSLLIPEHYQDDLAYILLSAGALHDRYEWNLYA